MQFILHFYSGRICPFLYHLIFAVPIEQHCRITGEAGSRCHQTVSSQNRLLSGIWELKVQALSASLAYEIWPS